MPKKFINHLLEQKTVVHEKAFSRFCQEGFPERKGAFQYVPLHHLCAQRYEKQEHAALFCSYPSALPLSEAQQGSFRNYLVQRTEKLIKEMQNPLALLNIALSQEGYFIYIPPEAVVEEPIKVVYPKNVQLVFPRLHVFVGKGAKATLSIECQQSAWVNSFVDIVLEENGSLTLLSSADEEAEWYTSTVHATLKRSANFMAFSLMDEGKMMRQEYVISLQESGASASIKGLWTLKENQEAHTHILMRHLAPSCSSLQHFKGALKDQACASFEGKIFVDPCAQKTEAYQLCNHLLLSKDAQAYSKPNLEIFADDVKASHGSTTTSIQEKDLFYLKTRGLNAALAKELLVEGFCKEILEQYHACRA